MAWKNVSFASTHCFGDLPSEASADICGNRGTRSQTEDGRRDPSVHCENASTLIPHVLDRAASNGGWDSRQKAAEQSASNDWD